ncbi:hypothetical protein [Micromonospora sp. NPDC049301]|uniref:hypothetical protein n=1 Tax=Micromonospora sp. NPDC049301 TaxID=3155723 RepID=UPI00343FC92F
MTTGMTWSRRLLAAATLAVVGLAAVPGTAGADTGRSATGTATPRVTTATPVNYSCYVTFPGGSTTVPFGLTFTSTAPERVAAYRPFSVTLDPQQWTPDPTFNLEVRNVTVRYRLPANAWYVWHQLSGGLNLGSTPPQVKVDYAARTLTLTVAGPLPASVPFDLPTVTVYLLSGPSGVAQTATGGTSLTDPSWSWVRTDLEGVQRPFDCNPATPVVFSSTTIG